MTFAFFRFLEAALGQIVAYKEGVKAADRELLPYLPKAGDAGRKQIEEEIGK